MADPRTLTFQIDPELRKQLEEESKRTELSIGSLVRLRLRASYALGERAKIPRKRMEVHHSPGPFPDEEGEVTVMVFDSEHHAEGKKRKGQKR